MAYLEQTQLTDSKDVIVNPSSEESIILLRRIAKFLEPSATQDLNSRQRIVLDAITAGTTLPTVTTVTTVSAVTGITNALPAGTNVLGYVGMIGDTRTDFARNTYANGIRRNLIFT